MFFKRFAVFLILFTIFSCNTVTPSNNPTSGSMADKTINNTIKGKVEFPNEKKFNSKATFENIKVSATVSLINPADNTTIATSLTDSSGSFAITFSSNFQPTENQVFILEASKRLIDAAVGNPLSSLRTYVKRSANNWYSITDPEIKINSKTTALSVIAGLNSTTITPESLIGKIDSDDNSFEEFGAVTNDILIDVTNIVNDILEQNADPIQYIKLINNQYKVVNPDKVRSIKPFLDRRILFLGENDEEEGMMLLEQAEESTPITVGTELGYSVNTNLGDPNLSTNKKFIIFSGYSQATSSGLLGLAVDGSDIIKITDMTLLKFFVMPNNKILFSGDFNGVYNVGIMNQDGSNVQQLSSLTTNSLSSFIISPDKKKYSYIGHNGSYFEGFVGPTDGSSMPQKVTGNYNIINSSNLFSPDSNWITFINQGGNKLYLAKTDGSQIFDLSTTFTETTIGISAAFSPDGNNLVVQRSFVILPFNRSDLYHVNLNNPSVITNITAGFPNSYHYDPRFSKDSSKILWRYYNANDGSIDLYSMDSDGTGPYNNLTSSLGGSNKGFISSPYENNNEVLQAFFTNGSSYLINDDGTGFNFLTDLPNDGFVYSPEGDQLIFRAGEGSVAEEQTYDFYSVKPDGEDLTRLTESSLYIYEGWSIIN